MGVIDYGATKRRRAATEDPHCPCGNYRAICSSQGRACVYGGDER